MPTLRKKANEVWTLMELEPGDTILANHGTSKVLALGEVVEPGYEWRPEREQYQHTVHVNWDTSYAQGIAPQKRWAFVTVAKVSAAMYQQVLSKGSTKPDVAIKPSTVDPVFADIASALKRKGQAILYGPPGTGKTYTALRFSLWWLMKELGETAPESLLVDDTLLREAEGRLVGKDGCGHLTRLTFHASYCYEDFIEGFRPTDTGDGTLSLRLEDGVFKRVCRQAASDTGKPYLVFIDEVNRANIAKVFGELITVLEKDKRGTVLTLPQSKQSFSIPPNVYLLGTMNTADRSIKLLDAALRRRFAFLELMPDTELLRGATVGNLALDEFLEELNRRIAKREGREKQIGHSFLLEGDSPVSDPVEFGRRFRQEILPLLQEYCYDDYAVLAEYVGKKLVNSEAQNLDQERLASPDALLEALEEEFRQSGADS